jgi:DNA-binding MarR family transcriptional regulator
MKTVPQALGRLRVAQNHAFERAAKECGLSVAQAELLCAAMAPATVGGLAQHLNCDRTNVTRLADRAEFRGLLTRGPAEYDRRVTLVELTPAGLRLARRFIARLEAQLADELGRWPERRRREAVRALDSLADLLEGV